MKYYNLEKEFNEISQELYKEYKKQLGDSEIAKSLSVSVSGKDGDFKIEIDINDYWVYIENGRKPNSKPPPLKAMINFVKKNNLPLNKGGKLYTVESLAYVIGRSIAKKGIKPKHSLQKSIESIKSIDERLAEAFAKDVEIELQNSLNKIK